MILDKENQLSDSQAVTASAASTNTIDQGKSGNAYGNELFFLVQVREAVTAAGAATVNFQLETSDASDFATKSTLIDSGAIGKAVLTANTEPVKIRVPAGAKRYIRAYYTVGTGPLTAGKFDIFLASHVRV